MSLDLTDDTYTYRFRWYVDDLIGEESKDERNFYQGVLKEPKKDVVVSELRRTLKMITDGLGVKLFEVLSEGRGAGYVMERMKENPDFYFQEIRSGSTS